MNPIVVITGAAGFLGSAVCLDLSKDCKVIAIDRREPSYQLKRATPQVTWHILDIADTQAFSELLVQISAIFGPIDYLIHLAAYYDFGTEWVEEYQRTNVDGTANILEASKKVGVKRLIFASSIAAMEPPPSGSYLTEVSPGSEYTPYARSKSLGEKLLLESSEQLPCIILRIAGVFSDWCELPPLYSLISLWSSTFPLGNIIPGKGESGIPFIHMDDFVHFIRKCIIHENKLGPQIIFLASPQGAVSYRDLFTAIQSENRNSGSHRPIYIPQKVARFGVRLRELLGHLSGNMPFERPWMLNYTDKPWLVDTSKTRQILEWDCTPELSILTKIPDMLSNRRKDPENWRKRNESRSERR